MISSWGYITTLANAIRSAERDALDLPHILDVLEDNGIAWVDETMLYVERMREHGLSVCDLGKDLPWGYVIDQNEAYCYALLSPSVDGEARYVTKDLLTGGVTLHNIEEGE